MDLCQMIQRMVLNQKKKNFFFNSKAVKIHLILPYLPPHPNPEEFTSSRKESALICLQETFHSFVSVDLQNNKTALVKHCWTVRCFSISSDEAKLISE